uniref:Uncharacterized protein n=1 Tax=Mimiviridae sp. ChoanoV1 TaxID=2596887 RepID=A0A5B8IP13_9VIRU|nr:hypothetical protein 1_216 [Mimiviridae sp. ChoanoV1]
MEDSEIVVSVLLPIFIGPLFIFFKELWDRYNLRKDNIKKIEYDDRIEKIREQLNNFYWPVLIKLKCLSHLNYSEVVNENIELKEIFLNDSFSDTMPDNFSNKKKINRKKGKICGNKTINNGEFVICQNIIQKPEVYKMCQKCLNKDKIQSYFSDSDFEIPKNKDNISTNTEKTPDENIIKRKKTIKSLDSIPIEEHITLNIEDSPKKIKIDVVDDTSGTSSNSKTSSDLQDDEHLLKKTIKIEKNLKNELDKKIIELCLEIKDIIEKNISIIKPDKKLGRELVKFIRFIETVCIIDNYKKNIKNINDKKYIKYNYKDLGVSNNTKKLIKIIKENLNLLLVEEQEVKENFLY